MEGLSDSPILLPLFPLPNLVFFPSTRLPLHIFEPRYRQMVRDALDGAKQIGIVLLRAGWESDYGGAPPIHPVGTLGTIEQALPLDDGRYNIIVRGDVRFRVLDEVATTPYRTARVVRHPETPPAMDQAYAQREWLADLSRQYLRYLPDQSAVPEIETVDLSSLTNALIMSLNVDTSEKQRLLEIDEMLGRAEAVGNELTGRIESLKFLAPFRKGGDPGKN